MDAIFGMEFPLLLKFVISFAVVLVLIGAAAFLWLRFGPKTLTRAIGRSAQQPRLAVVDMASIDEHRSLVLVRRDNTEHLLLIGGSNDLVVEPGITQVAARATHEPDLFTRSAPLAAPNLAAADTAWPPAPAPSAPEVVARPDLPPKIEPRLDVRTQPPPREEPAILPEPVRAEPAARVQPVPAFQPDLGPETTAVPNIAPPPLEHALASRARNVETTATMKPPDVAPPPPPPPPQDLDAAYEKLNGGAAPPATEFASPQQAIRRVQIRTTDPAFNEDQNLADMAQRLEAALRRPLGSRATPVATQPPAASAAVRLTPEPSPATESAVSVPVAPVVSPQMKPLSPTPVSPATPPSPHDENATYETLQREMASLLGRKPGSS